MTTVAECLRTNRESLKASPTPRLDSELLVAHGLQVERSALFRDPERRLSQIEQACINKLLDARRAGRPVAQIIGQTEFFSIEFAVNEHVLCPRADTELLVDKAIELLGQRSIKVVDAGTGSGAIATALAKNCPNAEVIALDLSPQALEVARTNIVRLGLANVMMIRSDWLDTFKNQSVDMVVSNPPYVKSGDPHLSSIGTKFEPQLALDGGPCGLQAFKRLIPAAGRILRPGGVICLEHGHEQAAQICSLLGDCGFDDIETYRDIADHERVCVGRKR